MLNDEIIDVYLYLLTAEDPTNLILPTQFMTKLMENNIYCYNRVTRWTNRYYTLEDFKSIYVPINYDTHWTLLFIDVSNQSVKYLDSALNQQKANYYMDISLRWLQDEAEKRQVTTFNVNNWTKTIIQVTQQRNRYDCGVFVLANAESIIRKHQSFLSQDNANFFRIKILNNIIKQHKFIL